MSRDGHDNNIQMRFKREHNNNLISISTSNNYEDNYQIKMLKKNNPDHFLKIMNVSINEKYYFEYDITSKQQFSSVYDYNKLNMEIVKSICVNISELVRTVDAYMLDLDKVLLKPSCIYMNIVSKKLFFIYYPEANENSFATSLKDLFEYILEHFDHSTGKENVVRLYDIYQRIIMQDYDPFNLLKLFDDEYLDGKKYEKEDGKEDEKEDILERQKSFPQKEIETVISEPIKKDVELKCNRSNICIILNLLGTLCVVAGVAGILRPGLPGVELSFSKCIVSFGLGVALIVAAREIKLKLSIKGTKTVTSTEQKRCDVDDNVITVSKENQIVPADNEKQMLQEEIHLSKKNMGETQLLSDYIAKRICPQIKLFRIVDDNSDNMDENLVVPSDVGGIKIDRFPFVFGNMEGMVDVVINSPVISRIHARIINNQQDDSFYLEDMNSLNGSFINDERVLTHTKKELHDGDILRLSNICFKVEIS